jgi:SAM-dependent methyltransferase
MTIPHRAAALLRRGRRCGGIARRAPSRLRWALEDRRLADEQRRGVIGPAHRRWRDNSASWNRATWDQWDWSSRGEEWTLSEAWKSSLIEDVLLRWIPAGGSVLEIGPGGGRWSEALLAQASRLVLVDVSERPLQVCRERFGTGAQIEYIHSVGNDLPGVTSRSINAVWSFDAFVHIAPTDQAGYLSEFARVLLPGGVAIIHHADGRNRGVMPSRHGSRSPMSRHLFAVLARERGLNVEAQFDRWGPGGIHDLVAYGDVITVCSMGHPEATRRSHQRAPVAHSDKN